MTGVFALAVRAADVTPAAYRLGLRPVGALIWHEAGASTLQLLLNVGILLLVGAAGLALQRRIWTRRVACAPSSRR